MGNMKDVTINSCFFNNPRCTIINVDQDSVNEELFASINSCMFMETGSSSGTLHNGNDAASLAHQDCPILQRDIDDAGKLVVVHNGSKVHCNAAGNSYRGSGFECSVSNGSRLQFSSMDMPLKDLEILKPSIGDLCRGLDGLYLYKSSGWANLTPQ